ncbi:hydrolase [Falsiroseomonas sp. CW058]|uniref:hydrolase n=1 Tax=Falsiroseomonas sp. CW058 TaxID=3388664 RepID=UPI003D31389C
MQITRRAALLSALALAAPRGARAQPPLPPVLFVHGNGDHAALWMTTLWRWESNGWPRDRLMAVNMPDPLARDDDAVPQPGRSGSAEQTDRLAAFAEELRRRTGSPRIAAIGNSRGGYPIRDLAAHRGGGAGLSHAVLCGTPNRGVYDWPEIRNREFNANSDFLRRLNGGTTDVVPGTEFLTLRSDANDVFAQPRAIWSPTPDRPTGTDVDGPELRGATNLVLPGLDHREVAYHWRAFREQFRFIAGREPATLAVTAEAEPVLDGLVTSTRGGPATNRPVTGAVVEVWRVHPATAERIGEEPLHRETTGADGSWGPVTVAPDWSLEFVIAAPDHPVTHSYRGPYPRSSDVVHLRPARPLTAAERESGGGVLLFTRPRGYFGIPRDVVLVDGRQPPELRPGVAIAATATLRLPAAELGRPVPCIFNEERVVARAWPAAENRIAVAELTW